MKCSIQGCPGEYEVQAIVHAAHHQGGVIVIDNVPAEVCSICGDTLFTPETVRRIEALVRESHQPARTIPLYEFAASTP